MGLSLGIGLLYNISLMTKTNFLILLVVGLKVCPVFVSAISLGIKLLGNIEPFSKDPKHFCLTKSENRYNKQDPRKAWNILPNLKIKTELENQRCSTQKCVDSFFNNFDVSFFRGNKWN